VRCRAGRPIDLVQIRVVDAAMNDLPRDSRSAGEIVVRAPWLTQGYLHDQAASNKLWEGGWLHTGDIGMLTPDGYLRITDRLKDVIKTGGEWVSSLDLEDMLRQTPQIAEAAVIGVPDPKWSERPLAIVVLRGDDTVEPDQVRAHLMGFVLRGSCRNTACRTGWSSSTRSPRPASARSTRRHCASDTPPDGIAALRRKETRSLEIETDDISGHKILCDYGDGLRLARGAVEIRRAGPGWSSSTRSPRPASARSTRRHCASDTPPDRIAALRRKEARSLEIETDDISGHKIRYAVATASHGSPLWR